MKIALCLIAPVLLTACNLLPKPAAVHDFGINSQPPAPISHRDQPVISVGAPKWLFDSRIRYRLVYAEPSLIRFYALDRWLAPPPELLEQFLAASDLPDHKPVQIYLQEFEQQFSAPDQAKVVMRFRLSVPSAAGQPEKSQEFRLQQVCPSANAKGAISAFTVLAQQATVTIKQWLQQP
jgi:cholesterol transport system auxiliary component